MRCLGVALGILLLAAVAGAAELRTVTPTGDFDEPIGPTPAEVELTGYLQPQPAVRPAIDVDVSPPAAGQAALGLSGLGLPRSLLGSAEQLRGMNGTRVTREGAFGRAATDVINLLDKMPGTEIGVQHRNPIINDPRVRGARAGQLVSSGSYWLAARPDLDTALSKLDAHIIDEVTVIKGPYSTRYGAGFNVIDVAFAPTPRYAGGPETHGSTTASYKTNGEQWYGLQRFWGGDETTGWRVGYAHATAGDFHAGGAASLEIPSSYNSRLLDLSYGWDIADDQRIEVTYIRLDQTGVELPAQFFDINYLVTNAFEMQYQYDLVPGASQLILEAWINRTRFTGDTARKRNPNFPVLQEIEEQIDQDFGQPPGTARIMADVAASAQSAGGRLTLAQFGNNELTLHSGLDILGLQQRLTENFVITNPNDQFMTNQPKGELFDLGAFSELRWLPADDLTARMGLRGDYVGTDVDPTTVIGNNLIFFGLGPGDLPTERGLGAAYVVGEWQAAEAWRWTVAGGYAERAPTLNELYADGVFMGVLQSGFARLIGNPTLDKERNWQIDLSLNYEQGPLQARITAYHSWIQDYITYTQLGFPALTIYTSTDLATLAGMEGTAEYALDEQTSLFGTFLYQDGRDRVLNAPLAGILPLQAMLGVRWRDPSEFDGWGVELAARMSPRQDRLGTLRDNIFGLPSTVIVEQETAGFAVGDLRTYYRWSSQMTFIAGLENFTNQRYRDHLDLRNGPGTFQPGFNCYFGTECTY